MIIHFLGSIESTNRLGENFTFSLFYHAHDLTPSQAVLLRRRFSAHRSTALTGSSGSGGTGTPILTTVSSTDSSIDATNATVLPAITAPQEGHDGNEETTRRNKRTVIIARAAARSQSIKNAVPRVAISVDNHDEPIMLSAEQAGGKELSPVDEASHSLALDDSEESSTLTQQSTLREAHEKSAMKDPSKAPPVPAKV